MLDSDRRLQRKRVIFLGLPIEDEAPSLSRARDRRFGFRRRFVRFVDLHGVGNGRSSPEKDAHVAEEGGRAGLNRESSWGNFMRAEGDFPVNRGVLRP